MGGLFREEAESGINTRNDSIGSKCLAFVLFAASHAEPAGILLKFRCSFDIKGLELYRSVAKKVSKRTGAPFMKLNGKSRFSVGITFRWSGQALGNRSSVRFPIDLHVCIFMSFSS